MAKYVYPAIFTQEDNKSYSVFFPDLEGCYTCGDDLNDAIMMAEDVLAFVLYDYEAGTKEIPAPSKMEDITLTGKEFVNYIACNTLEYAKRHNNKAVKKTLTIPAWLNDEAEAHDINFSGVLQAALKKQLKL